MGAPYRGLQGELGTVTVDGDGRGKVIGEIQWGVGEMVGRGVVVERVEDDREDDDGDGNVDDDKARQGQNRDEGEGTAVVVGVVARSAGVWENAKVVCACSGKTVWEEREEMMSKGID